MSLFRRRRRRQPALSLFFATDLHGSEKCFGKFLNAAKFYGVDALVLGGDLSGKIVVPVVLETDGTFSTRFLDQDLTPTTETEAAEIERRIRLNGYYSFRCTREELQQLQHDPRKREERVREIVRESLVRWMERANAKLAEIDVPCVGIPGNDDDPFVGELLEQSTGIANCDERVVSLDGFQVLGFGYSNLTPFNSPRELPEEELLERLNAAAAGLEEGRPTIFNVHVPPRNSGLDFAPELTAEHRLSGQQAAVGSSAVSEVIERLQPVVSLHGHVHESRGAFTLGRSLCLNPGSEYNVGVLRGVIVRLAEDGVISHQFVAA